jgi:hypothetical protein
MRAASALAAGMRKSKIINKEENTMMMITPRPSRPPNGELERVAFVFQDVFTLDMNTR